jgi:hypothetical protein
MIVWDYFKKFLNGQMALEQFEAQKNAATKEKQEAIENAKHKKTASSSRSSNSNAAAVPPNNSASAAHDASETSPSGSTNIKPPHRASVSSNSATRSQTVTASQVSTSSSLSRDTADSSPEVSISRNSKEDSDTMEARMQRLINEALEKQKLELAVQQQAQQKEVQEKLANMQAENERLKAEQTKWREEQEKERAAEQAARSAQEVREAFFEAQKSQETLRKQQEMEDKLLKLQKDADLLKQEKEAEIRKQKEFEEKVALEKKKIQEEAEEKLKQERAAHEAKIKADIEARAKLLKDMAEAEMAKLQKEKEQEKQLEEMEKSKSSAASSASASSASSMDPKTLAEKRKKDSQRELIIQALEEIIKKQNRIIQGQIKYTGDIFAYAKQASFNDLDELYHRVQKRTEPVLSPLLWKVSEMADPYKLDLRELAEQAKISLDKLQDVEMTVQIHDFEENCGLEKRMTYILNGYGLKANSSSGNAAQSQVDLKQRKDQGRELAIGLSKSGKPIVVHFTMDEHGIQINDAHEGNGDEYANAVKNYRGVFLLAKNKNDSLYMTLKNKRGN